jgi:hypothetical protein
VEQSITVDPVQLPVPAIAVHPGHCKLLQLLNDPHCEHVSVGVPWHVGPVENVIGGRGTCRSAVLQQIMLEQSLSVWHAFGHVFWQMPPQQSGLVASQSLDVVHAFGQGAYCGFRHKPAAMRLGSSLPSVVQHTSPVVVLHSVLVVHDLGQLLACVQNFVL